MGGRRSRTLADASGYEGSWQGVAGALADASGYDGSWENAPLADASGYDGSWEGVAGAALADASGYDGSWEGVAHAPLADASGYYGVRSSASEPPKMPSDRPAVSIRLQSPRVSARPTVRVNCLALFVDPSWIYRPSFGHPQMSPSYFFFAKPRGETIAFPRT